MVLLLNYSDADNFTAVWTTFLLRVMSIFIYFIFYVFIINLKRNAKREMRK